METTALVWQNTVDHLVRSAYCKSIKFCLLVMLAFLSKCGYKLIH